MSAIRIRLGDDERLIVRYTHVSNPARVRSPLDVVKEEGGVYEVVQVPF